eukprot:scaffold29925_cov36-Prasinocladus_malaysianus.AAC.1
MSDSKDLLYMLCSPSCLVIMCLCLPVATDYMESRSSMESPRTLLSIKTEYSAPRTASFIACRAWSMAANIYRKSTAPDPRQCTSLQLLVELNKIAVQDSQENRLEAIASAQSDAVSSYIVANPLAYSFRQIEYKREKPDNGCLAPTCYSRPGMRGIGRPAIRSSRSIGAHCSLPAQACIEAMFSTLPRNRRPSCRITGPEGSPGQFISSTRTAMLRLKLNA